MASYHHSKWPIMRWALYGLIGGIALGAIITAFRGNLGSTQMLISAVLSGGGLGTVLAALLAWLRNFVRGVM